MTREATPACCSYVSAAGWPLHKPGPVMMLRRHGVVSILSAPDRASCDPALIDRYDELAPLMTTTRLHVNASTGERRLVFGKPGSGRVVYRVGERCCPVAYLLERVA